MINPLSYTILDVILEAEANPDFKSNIDITVRVNDVIYLIPHYCLVDVLWGMPDDFYPCNKYEWADHPLYYTSFEMIKEAIRLNENKFKAFIKYNSGYDD